MGELMLQSSTKYMMPSTLERPHLWIPSLDHGP